jgi:hypothetical protein
MGVVVHTGEGSMTFYQSTFKGDRLAPVTLY